MGFFSSLADLVGIAAAPATGGTSLLATGLGAGAGLIGSAMQNNAAKSAASRQMEFQADMSGTAHQREVADLEKAGLNPLLSANAGASTPAGASYTPQNMGTSIMSGAASAQQLKLVDAQIAQTQAETADSAASAGLKAAGAAWNKDHPTAASILQWVDKISNSVQGSLSGAASAKDLIKTRKPPIQVHFGGRNYD